jgi:hypothetical protein
MKRKMTRPTRNSSKPPHPRLCLLHPRDLRNWDLCPRPLKLRVWPLKLSRRSLRVWWNCKRRMNCHFILILELIREFLFPFCLLNNRRGGLTLMIDCIAGYLNYSSSPNRSWKRTRRSIMLNHSCKLWLPLSEGGWFLRTEVRFPASFPHSPPFMRIHPRCLPFMQGGGGNITAWVSLSLSLFSNSSSKASRKLVSLKLISSGGSICNEILTVCPYLHRVSWTDK